jgi:hypothetical protein
MRISHKGMVLLTRDRVPSGVERKCGGAAACGGNKIHIGFGEAVRPYVRVFGRRIRPLAFPLVVR